MNTEQLRAEFEAWHAGKYGTPIFDDELGRFIPTAVQNRWEAYQAGRAALQSQDAERYRYLINKLQHGYDGEYFETDFVSIHCHTRSQFKGDRVLRAEITWRDKTDEPIGLSAAIDHARRGEENK